jgi:hypothetical protein
MDIKSLAALIRCLKVRIQESMASHLAGIEVGQPTVLIPESSDRFIHLNSIHPVHRGTGDAKPVGDRGIMWCNPPLVEINEGKAGYPTLHTIGACADGNPGISRPSNEGC